MLRRRLQIIALIFISFFSLGLNSDKPSSSTLLIGFDGVSFQVMQEMRNGGYFRAFQTLIPLVASFPSISDPAWAHITRAPVEEGYTKAHFFMRHKDSNGTGKEVGSVIQHITFTPAYEKKFNFKASAPLEHLANVTWTETTAHYWIDELFKKLLEFKSPPEFYSAFVINTDFISHLSGRKKLMAYLKFVDKKISKLQKLFFQKHNKKLEIIIVSDHGNYWVKPKGIDFKEPLSKKGWNWNSTLKNEKDFAFVAPEIISFGSFYTLKGSENSLAQDMAQVKGVHVTLALEKENVINVYSKIGQSQITVDPQKKTVSYTIISGKDPLEQIQLFKNSKIIDWESYFFKSQETNYPNALVNAWEGFYKNSRTPGSVLAASELGFAFTNMTLEILTSLSGLHSSHGSFHKAENYGVYMSTVKSDKEYIRPSEVWPR